MKKTILAVAFLCSCYAVSSAQVSASALEAAMAASAQAYSSPSGAEAQASAAQASANATGTHTASYYAGKRVSVLGDSYSTFEGYISPKTNLTWYFEGRSEHKNDVIRVEDTWWHQFVDSLDMKLEINNSYSGSTICCSGYRNEDYSDRTFIARMYNLGNPDLILVCGVTNDSWSKAPIGEYKYADWTKADLYNIRPAVAYMLSQMKALYGNAEIVFMLNTGLREEVNEAVHTLCKHYGVACLDLADIDKQGGHPSIKGMKTISDQVIDFITKD